MSRWTCHVAASCHAMKCDVDVVVAQEYSDAPHLWEHRRADPQELRDLDGRKWDMRLFVLVEVIESNRIESIRFESNRTEPNRTESNRIESNRTESNRIESNRIE